MFLDYPNDLDRNRRGLEFAGCYVHGCPKCFHSETWHPQRDKSMGDLYIDFNRRNTLLRNKGWQIGVMWECEWEQLKKTVPEVAQFLAHLDLQSPLMPREGF